MTTLLNILNLCLLQYVNLLAVWPIQVSSTNSLPKPVIVSATSFTKLEKSKGPTTDTWGTPAFNSPVLDIASLINTRCFHIAR